MSDTRVKDEKRQSVRIGMLPVLTLVVILGFATLAVLAVSTSHAMGAISQRQATATTDAYLLEDAGQRYVGALDDALATGTTPDVAGLASTAASQAGSTVSATAEQDGSTVTATFSTANGRTLAVELELGSSSVRIRSWKLTTEQVDDTSETLWGGAGSADSTSSDGTTEGSATTTADTANE